MVINIFPTYKFRSKTKARMEIKKLFCFGTRKTSGRSTVVGNLCRIKKLKKTLFPSPPPDNCVAVHQATTPYDKKNRPPIRRSKAKRRTGVFIKPFWYRPGRVPVQVPGPLCRSVSPSVLHYSRCSLHLKSHRSRGSKCE